MYGIIKKMFILLITNIVHGSYHTKCVLLSNQRCTIKPTLINLHPNEYSQKFNYYPFAVKLGRNAESCNNLNDLYNKVCVQIKQKI